jgi:hypothetical protein
VGIYVQGLYGFFGKWRMLLIRSEWRYGPAREDNVFFVLSQESSVWGAETSRAAVPKKTLARNEDL